MKSIIVKTLLKETLEFNGSISELKEQMRLKQNKGFEIKWTSQTKFIVLANSSFGIVELDLSLFHFGGIKGYGKLSELKNGKTKIELSTKLRFDTYLIGIMFVVFLLVYIFSDEKIPIQGFLLFPIMIIWFGYLFRFQEKLLFEKVKTYIEYELKKRSTTTAIHNT